MAITFINKGAFNSGAAALTVAMPASIAAGDLLLLAVETANQAITAPAGYTEVTNSPQSTGTAATAGGVRLGVFYKLALSSSEPSITVADSGDHQAAIVLAYRGVDTTTPIHISAGSVQAATTAMVWPSVTTSINDCTIVLFCAQDTDAASTTTSGALTNVNLTNITERHDQTIATATGGGLVINDGSQATAGATGTSSSTGSTSVTHAYLTIALKPRATPLSSGSIITSLTEHFDNGFPTGTFIDLGTGGYASSVAGGTLTTNWVAGASTTGGIQSINGYDLTNSSIYVNLLSLTQIATSDAYFKLISSQGTAAIYFDINGTTIYFGHAIDFGGSSGSTTNIAYSNTTHRWLRIRHATGTIFFDTATSSASNPPIAGDWTNRASRDDLIGPITSMQVELRGIAPAGSGSQSAVWDGLNMGTVGPPAFTARRLMLLGVGT